MPITCTCPTCNKPLRVPDELIGRLVRCPGCQGTFPATAAAPTPPPPPAPTSPQQIQPNPSPTSDLPNLTFDAQPESFVPMPPAGDRAGALALVKGPSLALMIVSGIMGGLSILAFIAMLAMFLVIGSIGSAANAKAANNPGGMPAPSSQPDFLVTSAANIGVVFVEMLLSLAWAVAVFLGAQRMSQLRTYPFAMTAAVLAMVPLSGCVCGLCSFIPWLATLGFGIWALVILCKPEVKAAFQ